MRFLLRHSLLLATMGGSVLVHVSLGWLGGGQDPAWQLAERESGRTSVAVRLQAPATRPSAAAEDQVPPQPQAARLTTARVETETAVARRPYQADAPAELAGRPAAGTRRPQAEDSPRNQDEPIKVQRRMDADRQLEFSPRAATQNSQATRQATGAEEPPRFVYRVQPAYPPELLLRRIGGRVELWTTIGVDGQVVRSTIKTSSGYPTMDEAAMKAVSRWRFTPARRGNRAVEKRVVVPVRFTPRS